MKGQIVNAGYGMLVMQRHLAQHGPLGQPLVIVVVVVAARDMGMGAAPLRTGCRRRRRLGAPPTPASCPAACRQRCANQKRRLAAETASAAGDAAAAAAAADALRASAALAAAAEAAGQLEDAVASTAKLWWVVTVLSDALCPVLGRMVAGGKLTAAAA